MNLNVGDRIRVHIFSFGREIKTRNFGQIFEVFRQNGRLGIEWEDPGFTPLDSFATDTGNVIFEKINP